MQIREINWDFFERNTYFLLSHKSGEREKLETRLEEWERLAVYADH